MLLDLGVTCGVPPVGVGTPEDRCPVSRAASDPRFVASANRTAGLGTVDVVVGCGSDGSNGRRFWAGEQGGLLALPSVPLRYPRDHRRKK